MGHGDLISHRCVAMVTKICSHSWRPSYWVRVNIYQDEGEGEEYFYGNEESLEQNF